ncbi:MAG: hypothetical protein NC122_02890 [Faecalibacterium sp.]|nr:hypothetical protein [Ruminococcus sp.]MCM1391574.1 hypothetical protein [Ruminococcus sp.]MCM1485131.1 hypothetical protein [Faecalibacterium sp.]
MKSICGIYCTKCESNNTFNDCCKTDGNPFEEKCLVAVCCQKAKMNYTNSKKY